MSIVALVLLVVAVALVAAAEWPRLRERLGFEDRQARKRAKRKSQLRVINGLREQQSAKGEKSDVFAASVQRDLESLPVIDPRDDRGR